MKTIQLNILRAAVPLLGLFIGVPSAYAAWMNPLEAVCMKIGGKAAQLSKASQAALANIEPGLLTESLCLKSELVLRTGRTWVYRQPRTKQYLLVVLSMKKDIREVFITSENYPEIRIERADVMMSDGVKLPTFVFHPVKAAAVSVFERSPYLDKNLAGINSNLDLARVGVRAILQVARGTSTAGGQLEWLDWKREREDARATLDWISIQKWNQAGVIAVGTSYNGFLALATATTFHPILKAVFATSSPWNPQVDSMSEGQWPMHAIGYLSNLNGGVSDSAQASKKIAKVAQKSRSWSDFEKKFSALSNLQFSSIPKDLKFGDNADLIAELKKVSIPMVYGFGVNNDQTSRDVLNLSRRMKGMPSHYFIGHAYGHSGYPLQVIFQEILNSGATDPRQFQSFIDTATEGSHACILELKDALELACEKDLESIYPTQPLTLTKGFAKVDAPEILIWKSANLITVVGTRKIKFTLNIPKLEKDTWMSVETVYCQTEECNEDSEGPPDVQRIKLMEGLHTYEVESQFQMKRVGKYSIGVILEPVGFDTYTAPLIYERKAIEVTLPVYSESK